MSRLRFATARALFETFPPSVTKLAVTPTDKSPADFLKNLSAQEKFDDAVIFCAYLLPRREAVWWACRSARALLGDIAHNRAAGLLAAEEWVHEPDDVHRQRALAIGKEGESNDPATWLALGAGWAGGFLLSSPQKQIPMPQYMTPRAVRIAIFLGALGLRAAERTIRLKACIAECIKLAETGL
jgi:hypothetical protein